MVQDNCPMLVSITLAGHGNAGISLHGWHTGHAGHTGHGSTCQIGSTVGAERPAQLEETFALGAGAFQFLAARWANLEV